MTTANTTFKASQLSNVMIDARKNMRKGALQFAFSVMATTFAKGEKLTSLEAAQLEGWDGEQAPRRKPSANHTPSADEKRIAERAKRHLATSQVMAEALAHIPDSFRDSVLNLYTVTAPSKFNTECETILKNIKFFEGFDIENASSLNEWISSHIPSQNGDDAEQEQTLEASKETSKAKGDPLEQSRKAAVELAKDTIALMIARNPDLVNAFSKAEKADDKTTAISIIAEAFSDKVEKLQKEIDTLSKIKTPAKAA
ncbi:hypothetical protein [Pseudoalteromonas sp.]|uniref:hypothetical protein n=1 Tax=Pseudoalteromonas sp. TaxID=53249 RepID=UPI00272D5E3F|nr:hypothetical protein [Pseudoalteromonas sp.]